MYSTSTIRLGIAYSKLNKHQQALDAYQKAIQLDPENVDYQNNMSVTKQRLEGKFQKFRHHFHWIEM